VISGGAAQAHINCIQVAHIITLKIIHHINLGFYLGKYKSVKPMFDIQNQKY